MIHLRPNLQIQCGDDGARANNCIVSGGTVQVDGTLFFRPNATSSTMGLSNVVLTGLTFTNVEKYHVWIDQPGQVLFRDCAFQVRSGSVVICVTTDGIWLMSLISTLYFITGLDGCHVTHLFGLF